MIASQLNQKLITNISH